jgi:hypothetical protein
MQPECKGHYSPSMNFHTYVNIWRCDATARTKQRKNRRYVCFFPIQLLIFPFCTIISSQMPFPFITSFFISCYNPFLILLWFLFVPAPSFSSFQHSHQQNWQLHFPNDIMYTENPHSFIGIPHTRLCTVQRRRCHLYSIYGNFIVLSPWSIYLIRIECALSVVSRCARNFTSTPHLRLRDANRKTSLSHAYPS